MDDNVLRVLQMLQEGKITAKEAESLIAALRGETTSPVSPPEPPTPPTPPEAPRSCPGFDFVSGIKPPKIDMSDLGDRISRAVGKVQPEKIVRKIQAELRTASQAGAQWGASFSAKVRTWTEGSDARPSNVGGLPEHSETHTQEVHLDSGAGVFVENPLGNVILTGIEGDTASISIVKTVWGAQQEGLKALADLMEVALQGTDGKLEIKVSVPDAFNDGTVDIELRVPRSVLVRASTTFGDVQASALDGRVEAVTRTGALRLNDLGGDVRGETVSGELRLERILGAVTVATQSGSISANSIQRGLSANTASGQVTAVGIEGGRVECKSVSGDVKAERIGMEAPLDITVESVSGDVSLIQASGNIALKAVSGDVTTSGIKTTRLQAQTVSGDVGLHLIEAFSGTMQVNTVSGDVEIALVEGSNLRASLSTTSGELRCDHDAHEVVATERLWTGQIGTGAGTLNVQTISGDAHIHRV
jgi:DUF4097 and DUF4098 domain-containing protein YvlB